jgi:hypothetical protein
MDESFYRAFRLPSMRAFEQIMLEFESNFSEYSITEVEYILWILH